MQSLKFFVDMWMTHSGDPGVLLEAANSLHPNLLFTLEDLNKNKSLD